jgi:hypothetical protein
VSFGPASPDAGVELLRQLFLQCVSSLILFPLFATDVVDIGGIGNLPPASLTPVANLPPVSTAPAELVAKFAAGVVDTIGKFAAGVVDTGFIFRGLGENVVTLYL